MTALGSPSDVVLDSAWPPVSGSCYAMLVPGNVTVALRAAVDVHHVGVGQLVGIDSKTRTATLGGSAPRRVRAVAVGTEQLLAEWDATAVDAKGVSTAEVNASGVEGIRFEVSSTKDAKNPFACVYRLYVFGTRE